MRLYLIRHTTPLVDKGVCYGRSDLPVDPARFSEELVAIRQKVPGNIDRWFTSPLRRCVVLADRLSSDAAPDDRLREYDFGDWELTSWNDIERAVLDPWMADFVNVAPPNGETYQALHRRTAGFVADLRSGELTSAVGVVTHAGVMRSMLCHVLRLPLQHAFRIKLGYGAVARVELGVEADYDQLLGFG